MVDFVPYKYNDFISHYSGLLAIMSNYPYIRIFNSNDIAFDLENLTINRISISDKPGGNTPTNIVEGGHTTTTSNNFLGSTKRFLGTYIS